MIKIKESCKCGSKNIYVFPNKIDEHYEFWVGCFDCKNKMSLKSWNKII